GQVDGALLLVEFVVGFAQPGNVGVDRVVEFGTVIERSGNDQRCARFVDQNRIDLVDDGVYAAPLHHVLEPVFHIIAQIIETELVIGAVSDVAVVLLLALFVVQPMHDDTDGQTQELVNLTHPFGVALGEIVVDGDDVHAAAGEGVEVDRKGRDQRFAFAGFHLGDLAFVENYAANELDIEVALPKGAFGGLTNGGERRHQDVVEYLSVSQLLLELVGARA